MKKLFMIVLSVIAIKAFGQVHSVGIQGGVNLTHITSDGSFGDSKFGIVGGFNYEYLFREKYTLSSDLLYNQKGFKVTAVFTDETGKPTGETSMSEFNYDYISLPLKIGYTKGDKIRGFAKIGICPSVLVKAEINSFDTHGNLIGNESFDVTDKVTKFDLAGLVEIGAGYKLNNYLELFSSLAFRKSLTSSSNVDHYNASKMKHYGYYLAIGIKYKLNKK